MYIGNMNWKHCRLETSFSFGNMDWILETKIGYWKHEKAFGNIRFILETNCLHYAFGNIKMIMKMSLKVHFG